MTSNLGNLKHVDKHNIYAGSAAPHIRESWFAFSGHISNYKDFQMMAKNFITSKFHSLIIKLGVSETIPLLLPYLIWQMALARDPGAGQEQRDAADQNFDYMFKLLIIGNSSVGKTSFLFRYADDSFTSAFVSTVGIDFKVKTIYRSDKRVKLQIWVRWRKALIHWSLKYDEKGRLMSKCW